MNAHEKTITMPRPLLDKWLVALRSGEYDQAKQTLREYGHEAGAYGYCCLGVLIDVVEPDGFEAYAAMHKGNDLPAWSWITGNGINFVNAYGSNGSVVPYLPKLGRSAAQANDIGKSFAEIADAIEAAAVGT